MSRVVLQTAAPAPVVPAVPDRLAALLQARAAPKLTPASSDSEMMAALQADAPLLGRVQAATEAAYRAARAIRSGPAHAVDRAWQEARTASLAAIAGAGGRDVIGTNTVADWTARVAMLRTALTAGEHFRDLVARYDTIADADRDRLLAQDNLDAASRAALATMATVMQAGAAAFDPQPFLTSLAQRGVHLAPSSGGAILASPGRALTAQDRQTLRVHKAAIVSALDNVEVF